MLKCSAQKCTYCVHAQCIGLNYKNTEKDVALLDEWSKGRFYCLKHMPEPVDSEDDEQPIKKQPKKNSKFAKICETASTSKVKK